MLEESTSKKDLRHEARRIALVALFGESFLSGNTAANIEVAAELLGCFEFEGELARSLINGVLGSKDKLDRIIQGAAPQWPLNQVAKVDLNCLRIAVLELTSMKQTPPKVPIDEAVELAKEFGSESSGSFVNGVLGTLVETLEIPT